MGFFIFILLFIVFLIVYHLLTKKYLNPYKLIMIFGKKGCGKTTTLAKIAYQHSKKGWHVFSTVPLPNAITIPYTFIGKYWFPENSVILCDEVGMLWDNRNFKNFKPEVRDWFKYQRHNKCKVFLFSQTFDIDKKLRDLTDGMYLLVNRFRVFSYGKKISKVIVLTKSTADSEGQISEDLEFEPFIFFWCGTRILTFIPRWSKMFDSHSRLDIPDLPDFDSDSDCFVEDDVDSYINSL